MRAMRDICRRTIGEPGRATRGRLEGLSDTELEVGVIAARTGAAATIDVKVRVHL